MPRAPRKVDLHGQKFGHWTVLKYLGVAEDRNCMWWCRCDCGTEKAQPATSLIRGRTTNCGCVARLSQIKSATKHGHCKNGKTTRIYQIFSGMKSRCYWSGHVYYHNYGGRGICVCDEWRESFQAFYEWAMSNGYKDDLTIDRINPNGDYSPENCRWATVKEQNNNRTNMRVDTIRGEKLPLKEISEKYNINFKTLISRYHHGDRGEQLIRPVREVKR